MLALVNGEKIVRTDKLICEVLNSAPAPVLPELLAARHQAGLAIFDATGRYRPSDEPYLNWPGKAQAWTQAISPTTARWEENLAQDGDHLYLEGDNLSVLKLLLPQLQGKVQVVYADPPYNTGKNFVYADNFVLSPSAYERRYGTAERCYGVAEPCSGAVSEAGRWHAQWCSFIYPRLLLACELMAENAVIFLSIDDHECHNLKLILDEVFGDANFVTQLVWQRAYAAKNDAKTVPVSHDYVLMYAKNKTCWEEATQPNLGRQLLRRTLVGDSQEGTQELKRLLQKGVFDGPKPVRLIKYLLELAGAPKNGIVLDFFAGSATTGQAVLELNAADGGSRSFILVQAPEPCAAKSPACQAGFSDIAQIGLERLNAVSAQLRASSGFPSSTALLVNKFNHNKDAVGGGYRSKYIR